MAINGRLLRLEKVGGFGPKAAVYLILPAGATDADEERAKALKLRELGLMPQEVAVWFVVKGLTSDNHSM